MTLLIGEMEQKLYMSAIPGVAAARGFSYFKRGSGAKWQIPKFKILISAEYLDFHLYPLSKRERVQTTRTHTPPQ